MQLEVSYFAAVWAGPGAHPSSRKIGTGSFFPGVKYPARGVGHPLLSSVQIKVRVDLNPCSISGTS